MNVMLYFQLNGTILTNILKKIAGIECGIPADSMNENTAKECNILAQNAYVHDIKLELFPNDMNLQRKFFKL